MVGNTKITNQPTQVLTFEGRWRTTLVRFLVISINFKENKLLLPEHLV